jgi:hypothetical protein
MQRMLGSRVLVLLVLGVGFCLAEGCERIKEPKQHNKPERGYESPREAFDAFKDASTRGDYRTQFHCLTPDDQGQALFWMVAAQADAETADPKTLESLRRNGPDWKTVDAEYRKEFRKKFGADPTCASQDIVRFSNPPLAKSIPDAASASAGVPPAFDGALLYEVVVKLIPDKAKLYEEVCGAYTETPPPMGELHNLNIKGDTAVGYLSEKSVAPAASSASGGDRHDKDDGEGRIFVPFRFRKLDGRWFVTKVEIEI